MFQTERLILRPWKDEDLIPFAKMNADPRVREFFPSTLNKEASDAEAKRIIDHYDQYGWTLWAVSTDKTNFIGFIGLIHVPYKAFFTPAVEIGWRLDVDYWGKGYATEGAKACLTYGFKDLNLNEIVALTTVNNIRSRKVMEKIGMHHNPNEVFDHPKLPKGHPLIKHVLYRIQY